MFRVIGLAIVIFVALLFALSMGEDVGRFITHHMGHLFDVIWAFLSLIGNQIQQFFLQLWSFMQGNRLTVLIALALTCPVTYWLVRQRTHASHTDKCPNKNSAIALAVFLGWLAAPRFSLLHFVLGSVLL